MEKKQKMEEKKNSSGGESIDGVDGHHPGRQLIYVNTLDFIKLPKTGLIGILPLQAEGQSLPEISEKVRSLVSLVHTYHVEITPPYLFGHPSNNKAERKRRPCESAPRYINTRFKVEEVKGKPYAKHLSRKERKALRKSIRKSNI
ncbi:hypothetical protein PCYB_007600 [Plasmodium cynomolgi strain B]|uniref:Uncharacterized protein n=1 Tax=Plasmodium cynomolgi (strain B) TaxID=1120755 RepID=K6UFF5_PLACD|nr:hypothetical protein PCYB_007600 [Plasmodium cynomolgi strain B]GAB70011.1 hypothetical protein PCYB_007600 [Plasmodium cynomolgi strain B]